MTQINQLPAVTTPAANDLFVGQQAGGATLRYTPGQIAAGMGLQSAAYLTAGGANGAAVLDASGNASALNVLATGATAPLTLAERGAREFYIEDFGGGTGATSAQNAAAIVAMSNAGFPVRLQAGNYNIDSVVSSGFIELLGADSLPGFPATTITAGTITGGLWLSCTSGYATFRNLHIRDNGSGSTSCITISSGTFQSLIDNCYIQNASSNGVGISYLSCTYGPHFIQNSFVTSCAQHGISIQGSQDVTVNKCTIYNNTVGGIHCGIDSSNNPSTNLVFTGNTLYDNDQGVVTDAPYAPGTTNYSWTPPHVVGLLVDGNTCYNNGNYNLYVAGCQHAIVTNNISYYTLTSGLAYQYGACILAAMCSYTVISNNNCYGTSWFGIDSGGSYNSTITGNVINARVVGINAGGGIGNSVTNNRIYGFLGPGIGIQLVEGPGSNNSCFGLLQQGLLIADNYIDYSTGTQAILLVDNCLETIVADNFFVNASDTAGNNAVTDHTSSTLFRGNSINGAISPTLTTAGGVLVIPDWAEEVLLNPAAAETYTGIETISANSIGSGIGYVKVTNGGTGYNSTETITATLTGGTGVALGVLVYNGSVFAVRVNSNGTGYTNQTVTFSASAGSGAAATATAGLPPASNRRLKIKNISNFPLTFGTNVLLGGASFTLPALGRQELILTGLGGAASADVATILNTNSIVSPQTLTWTSSITLDFSKDGNVNIVAGGNTTFANPINVTPGQTGVIEYVQSASGSDTWAFGSNWVFSNGITPVASTAANARDVLFWSVLSNGTILASPMLGVAI